MIAVKDKKKGKWYNRLAMQEKNIDDFPEIPGCEILSVLGEGGMAKVYLGIEESLDRKVAIKVLEPSLLKSYVTEKRFEKEAKIAASLRHSNIIPIFSTGKAGNYHYMIMEYLEESLIDRMNAKPEGKIDPHQALIIVEAIIGALDYAHSKKIYHRDIKPENIMFRQDGTPVLVDFGIARAFDTSDQLTRSGQSMGTVHYMSPEQVRATKKIDGRTDIYSLGVVLYEMLTGKKPYEGDSYVSVVLMQIEESVPILPPELFLYQPLIDKMMAKDREKRIPNKKEFLGLMDNITDGSVIPLPQPRESKELILLDADEKLPVKSEDTFTRKYTLKEKLEIVTLGVLTIVFLLIMAYHLWQKKQQIQEKYNSTLTYINNENFKIAEHQAKEIKEKTSEKEEEFNKHIAEVKTLLEQNNPEKARESLEKAKKIKKTPELEALEKRINDEYARIQKQLKQMQDDKTYLIASSKNTIESYKKYLVEFPKGVHVEETKWKINKLKTEAIKKQKERMDLRDMEILIKRYNFFESKLNKEGDFKSSYEEKKRKNISVVADHPAALMWYNEKSPGKMDFKKAEKWIRDLNRWRYGGYRDWRLPTLEEAASLLRKNKNNHELHMDAILSEHQKIIWTQDRFSANSFWVVDFTSGTIKISNKGNQHQPRPVRSME